MKAQAEQEQAFFPAVTLTLTLESQAEVDAIHNLFNSPQILDALAVSMSVDRWTAMMGPRIREALCKAQGRPQFSERGYGKFFDALRKQFIPEDKVLVKKLWPGASQPVSTGGISSGHYPSQAPVADYYPRGY